MTRGVIPAGFPPNRFCPACPGFPRASLVTKMRRCNCWPRRTFRAADLSWSSCACASLPPNRSLSARCELACSSSKLVREVAEGYLDTAKDPARPAVRRAVAEGGSAEKPHAVRLLWKWGRRKRAPLPPGAATVEKHAKTRQAIEDLLPQRRRPRRRTTPCCNCRRSNPLPRTPRLVPRRNARGKSVYCPQPGGGRIERERGGEQVFHRARSHLRRRWPSVFPC